MVRWHQKFTNYQFIRQSAASKTKTKQKKIIENSQWQSRRHAKKVWKLFRTFEYQ